VDLPSRSEIQARCFAMSRGLFEDVQESSRLGKENFSKKWLRIARSIKQTLFAEAVRFAQVTLML